MAGNESRKLGCAEAQGFDSSVLRQQDLGAWLNGLGIPVLTEIKQVQLLSRLPDFGAFV